MPWGEFITWVGQGIIVVVLLFVVVAVVLAILKETKR